MGGRDEGDELRYEWTYADNLNGQTWAKQTLAPAWRERQVVAVCDNSSSCSSGYLARLVNERCYFQFRSVVEPIGDKSY